MAKFFWTLLIILAISHIALIHAASFSRNNLRKANLNGKATSTELPSFGPAVCDPTGDLKPCYFDKSVPCSRNRVCHVDNRRCDSNRDYFDHVYNKEDTALQEENELGQDGNMQCTISYEERMRPRSFMAPDGRIYISTRPLPLDKVDRSLTMPGGVLVLLVRFCVALALRLAVAELAALLNRIRSGFAKERASQYDAGY